MDPGRNYQANHPLTEQEKKQQQFQLFQESLPKVSQLAFQMLLNEIVPQAMAVENELNDLNSLEQTGDRTSAVEGERKGEGEAENIPINDLSLQEKEVSSYNTNLKIQPSHKLIMELAELEDEEKYNNILKRLRNIGFEMGKKMCEMLVFSNNPNLHFKEMDLLLIMKFICRDVWKQLYEKPIDNLKTNHRGTFYLIDYNYKPIQAFSLSEEAPAKELKMVEPFLEIPLGLIKGVLASLGYSPEEVICISSFVDKPADDRPKYGFPKGVSFHVQVNMKPK